jgi:hypothetical protein
VWVSAPACDDQDVCTDDICTEGECGDFTCATLFNTAPCLDDEDPCTEDFCMEGVCTHEPCPPPCNGCVNNGFLYGGTITVDPDPACIDDTITFTLSDARDTGGLMRVNCINTPILPAPPTISWTITKPDGTVETGMGPAAIIVADLPGTYSCVFAAAANRDCPPPPITIGPATADTCQSGAVASGQGPTCGIDVTVKEITFSDDCTMYDEGPTWPPCEIANPDRCWGAGPALTGVDWASVNNPDHPICYVRGAGMRLTVRIEVTGKTAGTATLRVVGPEGVTGEGTFSVPCGATEDRYVSFVTSPLPNVVKAYTPGGLSWSVQAPGETTFTSIGGTSHRIYVTFGTPSGSEPTDRRLYLACYAAWNAGTAQQCIDGVDENGELGGIGIHDSLNADPPLDPFDAGVAPPWIDDWPLMSGVPYAGECHDQAHLFNLAIQLIGAGGGNEYLTLASSDTNIPTTTTLQPFFNDVETISAAQLGITQDLDGDGTIGNETLELIFDFNPPPNPGPREINNFEGSVELPWGYYAVWPSLRAPTACCLLLQLENPLGAKQYWGYRTPSGGFGYIHYTVEVPFPTCPTSCPNPNP